MTKPGKIRKRSKENASRVLAFKAALVAQRKSHELTQLDVADRLGVKQATVAEFERYDSNPTLRTIQRYANAVDARIRFIVEDDCGPDVHASFREMMKVGTAAPKRLFEASPATGKLSRSGWRRVKEGV